MNPELQAKVANWRRKAADGTISLDEMRDAVQALREGRVAAATVSEKSRATKAKAKAEIKSADAMLDELGGL